MEHYQGRFRGSQNLELYYQSWQPTVAAKATIALVHGLGSHSGWWMNLVQPLVAQGYWVYTFDLRGHGQSPGPRGHVSHWHEYRDDFHQFCQLMQAQHPKLPSFALGHSLGGVIVLDYALRCTETLAGVIAIAPALGAVGVSPVKLWLGKLLSQYWPQFTLETGLSPVGGSRNADIVAAYANDPLRHTRGSARLATEFLLTRQWVQHHLSELTAPILILQGSDDPVVLLESSRRAFEQIQNQDKEYREYPGAYHDLHNDFCELTVVQDILSWLERHLSSTERFCQFEMSSVL